MKMEGNTLQIRDINFWWSSKRFKEKTQRLQLLLNSDVLRRDEKPPKVYTSEMGNTNKEYKIQL